MVEQGFRGESGPKISHFFNGTLRKGGGGGHLTQNRIVTKGDGGEIMRFRRPWGGGLPQGRSFLPLETFTNIPLPPPPTHNNIAR